MRVLVLACLVCCGGNAASNKPIPMPTVATTTSTTAPTATSSSNTPNVTPQSGPLGIREARRYMLGLVNRDRASQHLPPVELDEGAAMTAGQKHAEDMAHLGYLGHWGSDGSVPEQRNTEAGGADMIFENALCHTDEITRGLEADPKFDSADLDFAESAFFNETPPNDGHRKTILRPGQKRVGIGLALARPRPQEKITPCVSQEFTYHYGTYDKLPVKAKVGDTIKIAGTVENGAKLGGVGLSRLESPKPLGVHDLNQRRHYVQSDTFQMYFPQGFKTPIPLTVSGAAFSIEVPLSDAGKPGLYEVSVWGNVPGQTERGLISFGMRTILVVAK